MDSLRDDAPLVEVFDHACHEMARALTHAEVGSEVIDQWHLFTKTLGAFRAAVQPRQPLIDPVAALLYEHLGKEVTVYYTGSGRLTGRINSVADGLVVMNGSHVLRTEAIHSVFLPQDRDGG